MDNRPIGVFDSGLGGLTGVRELRRRLPKEDIIYFGDTGRVPYGSRSPGDYPAVCPAGHRLFAVQKRKVHHGSLRHCVQHLPHCRGSGSAGALPGCGGRCRPGSRLCHPQPPYRRDRHRSHHPLSQLRDPAASLVPGWRSPHKPARCSCPWWRTDMWTAAHRKSSRSHGW